MKKKGFITMAMFFGVFSLVFLVGAPEAEAFWVRVPNPPQPVARHNIIRQHERREAVWENCNYDAWKERVGDRPITEEINADNFGEFCEMHLLANDGRLKAANDIRKDLELPAPHRVRHPWFPLRPWRR